MTTQPMFCYKCGARVEPGTRFCPDCGDAIKDAAPSPQAPASPASSQMRVASLPGSSVPNSRPASSMMLMGIVALVAVAAAAYFLVLKKDDSGSSSSGNSEIVTIEDLSYRAPTGWWTDAAGDINTAALFQEDLNSPDVPKGPIILVERQEKASVNFEEEVRRPVDDGDTADKIRNGARYGMSGRLTGSELRFVHKESGKPDVVGRSFYLRGKNVFGPAISILYIVPAAQESKYADAFKAFLGSLDLKNVDNP